MADDGNAMARSLAIERRGYAIVASRLAGYGIAASPHHQGVNHACDFLIMRSDDEDVSHLQRITDAEQLLEFRTTVEYSRTVEVEMKSTEDGRFYTNDSQTTFSNIFLKAAAIVFVDNTAQDVFVIPWNYREQVGVDGDRVALQLAGSSVQCEALKAEVSSLQCGEVLHELLIAQQPVAPRVPTARALSSRKRRAPTPPPAPAPPPPERPLSEEEIRRRNWEKRKEEIRAKYAAKKAS